MCVMILKRMVHHRNYFWNSERDFSCAQLGDAPDKFHRDVFEPFCSHRGLLG